MDANIYVLIDNLIAPWCVYINVGQEFLLLIICGIDLLKAAFPDNQYDALLLLDQLIHVNRRTIFSHDVVIFCQAHHLFRIRTADNEVTEKLVI